MDLKAYFLHPEIPPEGQTRALRPGESRNDKRLGEPLRSLAEESGLVMCRSKRVPYTRLAQAATEYAKSVGLAERFHRVAYRAYWENGTDLGDMDALQGLAEEAGLDWPKLEHKLQTGEYDRLLQDQHDEALRIGIWAVPGFVVDGRFWFTGAQPIEMFRAAAKRALAAREHGTASGFGGIVIGEG